MDTSGKIRRECGTTDQSKDRRQAVQGSSALVKRRLAMKELRERRKHYVGTLCVQEEDIGDDAPERRKRRRADSEMQPAKKKIKPSRISSGDISGHDSSNFLQSMEGDLPTDTQLTLCKEEIARIMLSRDILERWVHAPFFNRTVKGCFVRVSIGSNAGKTACCCEISGVVETDKAYQLGNTRTNKGLNIKYGTDCHVVGLEYVSNQNLSDSEFLQWKTTTLAAGSTVPTGEQIKRKVADIEAALNHSYSEDDVKSMVTERERFRQTPCNYAMKKIRLMRKMEVAEENCDEDIARKLALELKMLENTVEEMHGKQSSKARIENYVNYCNRRWNTEERKKVLNEGGKKNEDLVFDPFARRRCQPKIITGKRKRVTAEDSETPKVTQHPELYQEKVVNEDAKKDEELLEDLFNRRPSKPKRVTSTRKQLSAENSGVLIANDQPELHQEGMDNPTTIRRAEDHVKATGKDIAYDLYQCHDFELDIDI